MTKLYVVNLWSVEIGNTLNWLEFTVTIGGLNDNRKFKLEYCGTELNGLSLSPKTINAIRGQLIEDYYYPLYDIKKRKQILKQKNCYAIEVEEEVFD